VGAPDVWRNGRPASCSRLDRESDGTADQPVTEREFRPVIREQQCGGSSRRLLLFLRSSYVDGVGDFFFAEIIS
jgi:hypothetical protein